VILEVYASCYERAKIWLTGKYFHAYYFLNFWKNNIILYYQLN